MKKKKKSNRKKKVKIKKIKVKTSKKNKGLKKKKTKKSKKIRKKLRIKKIRRTRIESTNYSNQSFTSKFVRFQLSLKPKLNFKLNLNPEKYIQKFFRNGWKDKMILTLSGQFSSYTNSNEDSIVTNWMNGSNIYTGLSLRLENKPKLRNMLAIRGPVFQRF